MAISDNLLVYLSLDEASGTSFNDSSPNNFDATGNASITSGVDGKISKAVDLTQTTGYIRIPANASFVLSSTLTYTISLWFKLDSLPSTEGASGYLFQWRNSGGSEPIVGYISTNGPNRIESAIRGSGATTAYTTHNITTAPLSVDTWYHVVFVGLGTGYCKIYVNGTDRTSSSSQFSGTPYTTNGYLQIGAGYASAINGRVDEFGVWNRALSSTEISTLYNSGNGLTYPFTTTSNKTLNSLAIASVKTSNGLAIANMKSFNALN